MSWEARMAAQRKAAEEVAKAQQQRDDAIKKAADDEKKRKQAEKTKREEAFADHMITTRGYRVLIEFTESKDFIDALESIKQIPSSALFRDMYVHISESRPDIYSKIEITQVEVEMIDTFDTENKAFICDVIIHFTASNVRGNQEPVKRVLSMQFKTDGKTVTYCLYKDTRVYSNDEFAEYDAGTSSEIVWEKTQSGEEFLDLLADKIVNNKFKFV